MSSANSPKQSFICYLVFISFAAHLCKSENGLLLEDGLLSPNGKNVDEPETRSNPNPADATNSQEAPVVDVGEQSQQFHTIPSIFVLQSLGERIRAAEKQIRANRLQIAVINRLLLATREIISKYEAENARRNISTVSADVDFQFSSATDRIESEANEIAEEANYLAKVDKTETAIETKKLPKFAEISYPIEGSYYIRCASPPWYLFADHAKSSSITIAALLGLLGRPKKMQQIPFVVANSSQIPPVFGLFDVVDSVGEALNSTSRIVYLRSPLLNKYARVVGAGHDQSASQKLAFSETAHVNFLGREGKFELLSCVKNCTRHRNDHGFHDFPHTIIRSVATQRFVRVSPELELFADEENELAATEFVFEPSALYMIWRKRLLPAGVYHIRFVVANGNSSDESSADGTSLNEGYLIEDDANARLAAVSDGARKGLFKLAYNFNDATVSLLSSNRDVYLSHRIGHDGRAELVFNETKSENIATKFDLLINETDGSVALRSVESWQFMSVVPEPKEGIIGTTAFDDEFDFDAYPGFPSHGDAITFRESGGIGSEKKRIQTSLQQKFVMLSADKPTKFYFERFD